MLPLLLPALIALAPAPAPADDGTIAFTQARVAAMNSRNVDALVDLYESGAEAVQADGRSCKGAAALRTAWQERLTAQPKVEVKDATYVAGPDEVFVYGVLLTSPTPGGEPIAERFSELRIKRHGRWYLRFESRQPLR
ncbi:MAG TPA: nuclear transport factor 2 family protein [Holophagaceae bacterium]|nr:nuclear transport factor 2 family protein [Holophagaceae bacterium]